jgi:hypothetical protein
MRRKSKLLFIIMVGLILFATIEATAQEQWCPDTCTAGPWTIKFDGVYPAVCKDASGNPIACYDYRYSIAGPQQALNVADALLPVCCENPLITYPQCTSTYPYNCSPNVKNGDFGDSPSKIFPPGSGDPTTSFGAQIGMVYALRSEPTGFAPNPHIYSSSQITGPISMALKSGKYTYYCSNILGPRCADCGVPPGTPAVVEKLIRQESGCVKLSITQDKCVQSLSLCDENCQNCVAQDAVSLTATSSDGRVTNSTLREISDIDGNQRCGWGRIHIGDGTCRSVPTGIPGKYYLYGDTCACTSTLQCYPGKTCQGGLCK